jgi:hypothetical protein
MYQTRHLIAWNTCIAEISMLSAFESAAIEKRVPVVKENNTKNRMHIQAVGI